MKTILTLSATLGCFLIAAGANGVHADDASKPASSKDSIALFDGKTLDGWKGRDDLWSVADGAIVGTTNAEDPIQANTFLILQDRTPANFELTFQFKIEGGNSGVQYRSKVIDQEKFILGGYQADIDFTNRYAGILYEERGRGILAERGESVTIGADGMKSRKRFGDKQALGNGIHPGEWNDYRVVANGNQLQHFINGTMTAEVIDQQDSKSSSEGVIGFQLHKGPPMVVRFKNIVLHPLP